MPDPLLDIPEAAKILNLGRATVRNAFLDGRISGVKLGKLVRFQPAEIQRIANEGLPPPPRVAIIAEGR